MPATCIAPESLRAIEATILATGHLTMTTRTTRNTGDCVDCGQPTRRLVVTQCVSDHGNLRPYSTRVCEACKR